MSDLLAFATARRQSRASLLATWLDGGVIMVFDGTRPANPDTAITSQTNLVNFILPDPCGTPEDGVWECEPLPFAAMVLVDGTPTWARILDDTAGVIADCDVGLAESGSALELDNMDLVAGAMATPTSLRIIEG